MDTFTPDQIQIVNDAVAMSEEVVCNYYKMSANQWLRHRYDVKTLADLDHTEIIHGPFAQIIRYKGRRKNTMLGSSTYDFYKICIQDHAILAALKSSAELALFPFTLYIITHELVHIVRFAKFLTGFDASPDEKIKEESRVHEKTHEILHPLGVAGMESAFRFYRKWRNHTENLII
ncbi:MAG: hypothetical protein C4522_01115 [Desulfobacteraceae bacterium]|nr:MAG: hypothetical protein C4522_01115 [Desulfobacteraceae bacterium]